MKRSDPRQENAMLIFMLSHLFAYLNILDSLWLDELLLVNQNISCR